MGILSTFYQVPVVNANAGLKSHTWKSEAQCLPWPFVSSLVYECSQWMLGARALPLNDLGAI